MTDELLLWSGRLPDLDLPHRSELFVAHELPAYELTEPGRPTTPEPDSECSQAAWLTHAEVHSHCPDRRWLPLLNATA
jgi:hypothetical protein